jgi:hypothetical protein
MAVLAHQPAAGAVGASARRTVIITGMRQIGTLNFDLLVEFDVTVLPDAVLPDTGLPGTGLPQTGLPQTGLPQTGPPYPATIRQPVSQTQLARLRPGQAVQALVGAASPQAIWLDLMSPR